MLNVVLFYHTHRWCQEGDWNKKTAVLAEFYFEISTVFILSFYILIQIEF